METGATIEDVLRLYAEAITDLDTRLAQLESGSTVRRLSGHTLDAEYDRDDHDGSFGAGGYL